MSSSRAITVGIIASTLAAAGVSVSLVERMLGRRNTVALAALPAQVSYVRAKPVTYRPSRTYVGALRPWVQANVGPQLVSAYVDTVLVRPGGTVHRGEVLATLDCRPTSAEQATIAMQARALAAKQKAVADEADRTRRLLDGGFASADEVEQALAQSAFESAQLAAQQAIVAHGSLQVDDCILRAPFDGEIGDRFADPGAYVRPGTPIVSVVDRSTVRFVADAPEGDFSIVAPSTPVRIHLDATGQDIDARISRRAPHADAEVRTVHFEVDIKNPGRAMPVDVTAEVRIEIGDPAPATSIPLYAATIRGRRASLFVDSGDVARLRVVRVLDESGGSLIVDRSLAPSTLVVTEGAALLKDGDRIEGKDERSQDRWASESSAATGPAK